MGKSGMSIFETSTLVLSGISAESSVGEATSTRSNIFEMTQLAESAVLRPLDYGMFPHDVRAALACRIAARAGESRLAEYYAVSMGDKFNLAESIMIEGEPESTLIPFVDKAANDTKNIVAEDISKLQAVGVSDADIVRLCELIAFVAYQVRVAAGLRLMNGAI
jgi:uncharacterized protein YciW